LCSPRGGEAYRVSPPGVEWSGYSSQVLHQFPRCHNSQTRKTKFAAPKVADIVRHDHLSPTSYGQFHDMIVALVAKVGTPRKIYLDPLTYAQECSEQFLTLCRRER